MGTNDEFTFLRIACTIVIFEHLKREFLCSLITENFVRRNTSDVVNKAYIVIINTNFVFPSFMVGLELFECNILKELVACALLP